MDVQQVFVPPARRPHLRPRDRVLVAADLASLRGPASGKLTLPLWLRWQPGRTFDLDNPGMLRWVYEIVLREASTAADLTANLHGGTLVDVWPDLFLPRPVRAAWEDRHPQLRARRPAAATPRRSRDAARSRPAAGLSAQGAAASH